MAQAGLVNGNKMNAVHGDPYHFRSQFDLSYHHFQTHRFGEYTPHFVFSGVKNDHVTNRSAHNVRSFTLGAPLMQDIQMKKDYFMVPYEAILPLNWEKVFVNPNFGDDVNAENVNTILHNLFSTRLPGAWSKWLSQVGSPDLYGNDTQRGQLQAIFAGLLYFENFFSNGCLFANLGCHFGPFFDYVDPTSKKVYNFDEWEDLFLAELFYDSTYLPAEIPVQIDGRMYTICNDSANLNQVNDQLISWDTFLAFIRDGSEFTFHPSSATWSGADLDAFATAVAAELADPDNFLLKLPSSCNINYARLCAYQIACAHFYTNDHVDFVYSAQLWRQNMRALALDAYATTSTDFPVFTMNLVDYQYDELAGKVVDDMMNYCTDLWKYLARESYTCARTAWFYMINLLSMRRSLKFNDYFTGCRVQPLAVGNVNVNVSGGQFSVIDVTRNVQKQRFLNAVNRSGRKISNYMREIFGGTTAPDYHNPFYIGGTSDIIYGSEVENTGVGQLTQPNSITTTLRSNSSKFAFEFDLDRPAIVIGITSYDLKRNYPGTIEKHFFHTDRFDMFNPYFQFVGDQPISLVELGLVRASTGFDYSTDQFGFQGHYMEYKQRYNQMSGGFVKHLPGYAFVSDDYNKIVDQSVYPSIDPNYIRSLSSELDKYYLSLTSHSLAGRFHFIVDNYNDCKASRSMAFNPGILQ